MKLYDCILPDGRYQNPILWMDYSDPDVTRVGEDYYMVASSFTYLPGVPLLHSRDLIHWEQLAWCVEHLPFERYALPAHGCGTWAPAIRWHDGKFYVFVPLPDEGIFVTTAENPAGPWSELRCLKAVRGWIDPCPFWDDDGQAYMAHAFANSRCGIKHRIDVCRMAPDASRLLDDGVKVYQNELIHPTMEGPKMDKRGGWYYIFVPAGGVSTGWQTVLRSRSPLGPYEAKIVMNQGATAVNGPHQGAWITTPDGDDWFMHFQDTGVYGRVPHLEPMCWADGWPFIGQDKNGDGIGEPVESWHLPLPAAAQQPANRSMRPAADDDFSAPALGVQWQWQANPQKAWYSTGQGLQLNILPCARGESLLWYMPNVLTQLPQAREFHMETTVTLLPEQPGDEGGIAMMGHEYSALALRRAENCLTLALYRGHVTGETPEGEAEESCVWRQPVPDAPAKLRLHFMDGGFVRYSAVLAGDAELVIPGEFPAAKSTWSGAKPALFARSLANKKGGAAHFGPVSFTK